jgi:NADPH2 dehydrogenase
MSLPKLFSPTRLGNLVLQHRIVLAPLTRFRALEGHVPDVRLTKEYYSQRARCPGTLLIAEATLIAEKAGGGYNGPGIWNDEQIIAWKQVGLNPSNTYSFF